MYIQSLNGIPIDDWGFTAYLGANKRGLKVIFYEDIMEVPAKVTNIVVGCIEDTMNFFDRLDISIPEPLNMPTFLRPLADRWIFKSTLERQRRKSTSYPYFMKPEHKGLFPPFILNNDKSLGWVDNYPNSTEVYISEDNTFISEYRCFVIDGVIHSMNHYAGSFRYLPDSKYLYELSSLLYDNRNHLPLGYTADIGVTTDNKTKLIECNDGWSIGSYGCDPTIYTNLLIKRWREITGTLHKQ
jgi:hypothetical protein